MKNWFKKNPRLLTEYEVFRDNGFSFIVPTKKQRMKKIIKFINALVKNGETSQTVADNLTESFKNKYEEKRKV